MKIRGEDTLCKGPGAGKKGMCSKKRSREGQPEAEREERERDGPNGPFRGVCGGGLWEVVGSGNLSRVVM